jgi:cytochrome c peroxidase
MLVGCGPLVLDEERALGPLPEVRAPIDNPTTEASVALGRMLFWDPILSGDMNVACATCHDPEHAFADGRAQALGAEVAGQRVTLARNTPTVLDTAFNGLGRADALLSPETAPMFWDGRALSLEAQAEGPILASDEMRGTRISEDGIFPELVERLERLDGYRELFRAAYGSEDVDRTRITRALAAYERSLVTGASSFDRFLAGDDTALDLPARRGLVTFLSSGCVSCHRGPMFSDYELHDIGVGEIDPSTGRRPRIRTPSLRNVARTAPYMHDGSVATLAGSVDFYTGLDANLDPDLAMNAPLGGGSTADVVRFLESLSDGAFDQTRPAAVPSGLAVGGLQSGR